jgi:hypothetical protein
MAIMRALSIRQPWAWRILHEGKDVENRTWRTRLRGRILIHASSGVDRDDRDEVRAMAMPLGAVVGHVEIVDCVTGMDSPWFCGPYGFVLRDARPLPPIRCKGAQGFFAPDVRDEVLRMHVAGELSEGHAATVLGLDRIALRALCDGAACHEGAEPS